MQATIVVPTHDHATTLPLAVGSALGQTMTELEVVVVGDGVTPAVREVAHTLAQDDPRVVFLDLPKGPHHGELHRDRAVRGARSEAIFYLCDDDLLLPTHVANLLPLLEHADLVQCRNSWIDETGQLHLYPTDLADPRAVAWHLREPRSNATSLTGTAHTRAAYLALDPGWTTTPPNEWPDHYLWKQFFRTPGFRGATHPEATAVQLPTSMGREEWDAQRRVDELVAWRDRLAAPNAHDWLQAEVVKATASQLDETYRTITELHAELAAARTTVAALDQRVLAADEQGMAAERRAAALADALERARGQYAAVVSSRSWQLTRPARAAAALVRGGGRRRRNGVEEKSRRRASLPSADPADGAAI